MPRNLKRYYGADHLHFITCSCYQRRPLLGSATRRDLFLEVLEQMRQRYGFVVLGFVVMPEHVHLLISEPELGNPSIAMQAVKLGFARKVIGVEFKKKESPRTSGRGVSTISMCGVTRNG